MNMQVQPQQRLSAILSQVATVAVVRASALGMTRTDKNASAESERDHGALRGSAKVGVSRLAGAEQRVKDIRACQNEAREALTDNTTAWGDRRLLANVNIERFLKRYGAVKAEHDRLVQALVDDAPRLISNARANLGSFQIEPPTEEEIAGAFSLEFSLEQIPDSETYAAKGMDSQVEAELKRRFEANIASAYQQAQNDALMRLQKPLLAIVERMGKYNQREEDVAKGLPAGKEGYFRDTIITNLHEIADVFGSFNLINDPGLNRIAEQLAAFDGIEADDLRNSKDLRNDTAKRAEAILATLGDWL